MRTQVVIGLAAGAVLGAALLAGLWLWDGTAAFSSAHVEAARAGCGLCLVGLGAWLLARQLPNVSR
jgi:hypothetical protein